MTSRNEIFAICVTDEYAPDCITDHVERGRVYKVKEFVMKEGFYPYGVTLENNIGLPLASVFFMQRFEYVIHNLN